MGRTWHTAAEGRIRRLAIGLVAALVGGVVALVAPAAPAGAQVVQASCAAEGLLKTPPTTATGGLVNGGFEDGHITDPANPDAAGWTVGQVADQIGVSTGDAFTTPWEGEYMGVLGGPRDGSGANQTPGPNEICQDMVVAPGQVLRYAYNIFTYDYTGFDDFTFQVTLTSPATGEVLGQVRQGAFGSGTELKTTGWRGIEIPLGDYAGQTVRVRISAGGTSDSLYGFWAYIDSAQDSLPEIIVPLASVETPSSASISTNPIDGTQQIAAPTGSTGLVTFNVQLDCDGTIVNPVLIIEGSGSTPLEPNPAPSTAHSASVDLGDLSPGTVSVFTSYGCDDGTATETTSTKIATITLYDPSGFVTNAVTGAPVVGAVVTLFRVPDWMPDVVLDENGDRVFTDDVDVAETIQNDCRITHSRTGGVNEGAVWDQLAPTDLGVQVPSSSNLISPNINPQLTNGAGRYGWDVAEGCWYVTVAAAGYQPLTSPVVGVPPEVTDLDLALTPTGGGPIVIAPPTEPGEGEPELLAPEARSIDAACPTDVVPESGFADVPADSVHARAIACARFWAVVLGVSNDAFVPGASVTRAQMASFLARLIDASGGSLPTDVPDAFPDDDGSVHEADINRLAAAGILLGRTDGTFGAGEPLTRGQVAALLVRIHDLLAGTPLSASGSYFADIAGSTHEEAINRAAEAGFTGGTADGTFRHLDPVRRDQTASFLARLLALLVEEGVAEVPAS